jgi:lipid-binding SYLF domain-containing protein
MKGASMKKNYRFPVMLIGVLAALILSIPAHADKFTDTMDVYKKSEVVQPFFNSAYGYAVFPTIGKGGIGIGGAYGTGQVYQGGKVTGTASLVKVSVGWQWGGQAFSQIIFFEDKRAYDEFTSGNFEFDATASAVAITAGAQAKAGTEGATAGASAGPATGAQAKKANYHKGMAVFVHTKGGLMYEASIGGQKFTFKPNK